jgi:SulP family sulfate permease
MTARCSAIWLGLLPSLRGYRPGWLRSDVSAGLAIAAVGIPSAIAYPAIAGLPPETGIYASIGSVIGYAVLGPSRRLIVGPDAAAMVVLAAPSSRSSRKCRAFSGQAYECRLDSC